MKKILKIFLSLIVFFYFQGVRQISAQSQADWYMAGGNPERTSWVSEEVRGSLGVDWYQPIEPYIPYKVQPIFFNDTAYISTSKGLYAFNLNSTVDSGGTRVKWVYPTELPLGHSPTLATIEGKVVAYVGGYDRKIHAIDTQTGQALVGYASFEANAGFDTNPLIVSDSYTNNTPIILAGSRDGKFYAINAVTGSKLWEYSTGGPIEYSAAYKNGTIYFASNDLHAYALNVGDGTQIWKSQKFEYSAGFFSYWPVIYTDKLTNKEYVVFTGSTNYRAGDERPTLHILEQRFLVPGCVGLPGPACPGGIFWNQSIANNDPYFLDGTTLLNLNGTDTVPGLTKFYEDYPYRHLVYILERDTGVEYTYDSNGNGKNEYAPLTWGSGTTYSGTKYPSLVNGVDNIFYSSTIYSSSGWIARSDPVGWKFGSHYVSMVSGGSHAIDEPIAYSSGGRVMYWALCCDREAGAFDLTMPLSSSGRSWIYYGYDLFNKAPDFHPMYNDGDSVRYSDSDGWHIYSGKNQSKNGVYGKHGATQSPPIPYRGKVYILKGNTLFAWAPNTSSSTKLSLASTNAVQNSPSTPSPQILKTRLELEIEKIINAGPLKPGYIPGSLLGNYSGNYSDWHTLGDFLDYFHNPSDTVYTLLLAYPHLSSELQANVKDYLETNYGPGSSYDFTKVQHIGWSTGSSREYASLPPDLGNFRVGNPSTWKTCCAGGYWQFPPFNFYAAWKYAQIVGNNDPNFAKNIFNAMSSKIEAPTSDSFLIEKPYFANQYAAGYYGYLELKKLAGLGDDPTVKGYYDKVVGLLRANFSKDTPYWPDSTWCGSTNNCGSYWRATSVMRNFAFMTPEIAEEYKPLATQVESAVDEYMYVAPYWFVGKFDGTIGEGTIHHLYDSPSLIQAKAWILGESYQELSKYLDVPSFEKGDLFYIQNLVVALESPTNGTPTPPPSSPGDADYDGDVDIFDYNKLVTDFGKSGSYADFNQNGIVDIFDYNTLIINFGK